MRLGPETNPVTIYPEALKKANLEGRDILILDTAGRLHIDEDLMDQLDDLRKRQNRMRYFLLLMP